MSVHNVWCHDVCGVCVPSATVTGVCVASATVTGVCVASGVGHWMGFSKFHNDLQHCTCSSSYSKNPAYLSGIAQKHWNEVLVSYMIYY